MIPKPRPLCKKLLCARYNEGKILVVEYIVFFFIFDLRNIRIKIGYLTLISRMYPRFRGMHEETHLTTTSLSRDQYSLSLAKLLYPLRYRISKNILNSSLDIVNLWSFFCWENNINCERISSNTLSSKMLPKICTGLWL